MLHMAVRSLKLKVIPLALSRCGMGHGETAPHGWFRERALRRALRAGIPARPAAAVGFVQEKRGYPAKTAPNMRLCAWAGERGAPPRGGTGPLLSGKRPGGGPLRRRRRWGVRKRAECRSALFGLQGLIQQHQAPLHGLGILGERVFRAAEKRSQAVALNLAKCSRNRSVVET